MLKVTNFVLSTPKPEQRDRSELYTWMRGEGRRGRLCVVAVGRRAKQS